MICARASDARAQPAADHANEGTGKAIVMLGDFGVGIEWFNNSINRDYAGLADIDMPMGQTGFFARDYPCILPHR